MMSHAGRRKIDLVARERAGEIVAKIVTTGQPWLVHVVHNKVVSLTQIPVSWDRFPVGEPSAKCLFDSARDAANSSGIRINRYSSSISIVSFFLLSFFSMYTLSRFFPSFLFKSACADKVSFENAKSGAILETDRNIRFEATRRCRWWCSIPICFSSGTLNDTSTVWDSARVASTNIIVVFEYVYWVNGGNLQFSFLEETVGIQDIYRNGSIKLKESNGNVNDFIYRRDFMLSNI